MKRVKTVRWVWRTPVHPPYLEASIQRGFLIRAAFFRYEMADQLPIRLSALLEARELNARTSAWEAFVGEYSKILLRAVRDGSRSYDETMDRYTYVLERLQDDECRRLRAFSANGRGEFTTWIFVVARRLCVDHHRHRFGRPRKPAAIEEDLSLEQRARRRLATLVSDELDLASIPDQSKPDPEWAAWLAERRRALEDALSELRARDQLLITLRFVDGLSVREIAKVMRYKSPFQVYRRLAKILTRLRENLTKRGIAET